MIVEVLHYTPLEVADIAICKCYGNEPHSDLDKVKARINRVANVSKHASTVEHLTYSFDIDGISRACLQQLCRHRLSSYTIKSSRYTLQELKKEHSFTSLGCDFRRAENYLIMVDSFAVNTSSVKALEELRQLLMSDIPNDIAKYCMPEAYKTSLVMTINARSLQNFLELRSSKHALWEIQLLAKAMYEAIPDEHKFLYDNIMQS